MDMDDAARRILKLPTPWIVEGAEVHEELKEVEVRVTFDGSKAPCPKCGKVCGKQHGRAPLAAPRHMGLPDIDRLPTRRAGGCPAHCWGHRHNPLLAQRFGVFRPTLSRPRRLLGLGSLEPCGYGSRNAQIAIAPELLPLPLVHIEPGHVPVPRSPARLTRDEGRPKVPSPLPGLWPHVLLDDRDAVRAQPPPAVPLRPSRPDALGGDDEAAIARVMRVAPSTVTRWITKAAAHARLFHDRHTRVEEAVELQLDELSCRGSGRARGHWVFGGIEVATRVGLGLRVARRTERSTRVHVREGCRTLAALGEWTLFRTDTFKDYARTLPRVLAGCPAGHIEVEHKYSRERVVRSPWRRRMGAVLSHADALERNQDSRKPNTASVELLNLPKRMCCALLKRRTPAVAMRGRAARRRSNALRPVSFSGGARAALRRIDAREREGRWPLGQHVRLGPSPPPSPLP